MISRREMIAAGAAAATLPSLGAGPALAAPRGLDVVFYEPRLADSVRFAQTMAGAARYVLGGDLAAVWSSGLIERFAAASQARFSGVSHYSDFVVLHALAREAGGRVTHEARQGALLSWVIEKV